MLAARRLLISSAAKKRYYATAQAIEETPGSDAPFFPNEPSGPFMKTTVPGPESKKIMKRLDNYQDTRSVFFVAGKWKKSCKKIFFLFF